MQRPTPTIEDLWRLHDFTPNGSQETAIRHVDGPLYLTAGPGSGKTRVLLWRTLNLLVYEDVRPEHIFLSTFTEKAALQLREGLQALLGTVTNATDRPFDLTQMYVGTVHANCQRLLTDRRFVPDRHRMRPPTLLDSLGQYFHLYRSRTWSRVLGEVGLDPADGGTLRVNALFGGQYDSKHEAVQACIRLFNRLSEECVDPEEALARIERDGLPDELRVVDREGLSLLLRLYAAYRESLGERPIPATDFSLLQQEAMSVLEAFPGSGDVFRHVIIDEYQDTNTIQERLYFRLAAGSHNLCVVGDDDQALYRFRGATVENFVQFPERCERHFAAEPRRIPLSINYRSRGRIVEVYGQFMNYCDWQRRGAASGFYRVVDKDIRAHRPNDGPAVVTNSPAKPEEACDEIADLVVGILRQGLVDNPNKIAFLYPSLDSAHVKRMINSLEARGLRVYAPRAGRILEVPEATDMFGVLALLLPAQGMMAYVFGANGNWNGYRSWLHRAKAGARDLLRADPNLARYIEDRRAEIAAAQADHAALMVVVAQYRWTEDQPYEPDTMKRALLAVATLSPNARRALGSMRFDQLVQQRRRQGDPVNLGYALRRATTLDWSVLDAFYRICGTQHFRAMFDLAESGEDEGPVCNLALISQYIARFQDEYNPLITADMLLDDRLGRFLFGSYLFALWRLGEKEFENAEDPFPRGRIPFLTIHQAKGLEFPVVVLGNARKDDKGPQITEQIVQPLVDRSDGEPLDRMSEFDTMRMFYVALSRAQNLLVLAQYKGQGQWVNPPFRALLPEIPPIATLDVGGIPRARPSDDRLPRAYSYTGDYMAYQRCPRQYMVFRKYDFEASQTRTMFFGSLVHRTLDDLHNFLIARRTAGVP